MKIVTLEFNISDNFELYNCYMCPLYADDNYTIIESHDGSRVKYDKKNPRTEVTIRKKESLYPVECVTCKWHQLRHKVDSNYNHVYDHYCSQKEKVLHKTENNIRNCWEDFTK